MRVAVLTGVLAAVALWACNDYRDRRARNECTAPIRVGLVLLRSGAVTPEAVRALATRAPELERRLATEFRRYRGGSRSPLIRISTYGPIDVAAKPPGPPGDGLWDRVAHAFELLRYTREVDARAGVPGDLDSRIYVVATHASREGHRFVEGFSELGGRVGVVEVELDASTVDLGLYVAAHELFHTLGATDKYDSHGLSQLPDGLGDPEQVPLYPQRSAEIMARNRVLAPGVEIPPDSLGELRVGPRTAREIGWLR